MDTISMFYWHFHASLLMLSHLRMRAYAGFPPSSLNPQYCRLPGFVGKIHITFAFCHAPHLPPPHHHRRRRRPRPLDRCHPPPALHPVQACVKIITLCN
jgi:hypothetical protein